MPVDEVWKSDATQRVGKVMLLLWYMQVDTFAMCSSPPFPPRDVILSVLFET